MLEAPQQAKQLLLMMLMAASKHIGCHSLVPTLKKSTQPYFCQYACGSSCGSRALGFACMIVIQSFHCPSPRSSIESKSEGLPYYLQLRMPVSATIMVAGP